MQQDTNAINTVNDVPTELDHRAADDSLCLSTSTTTTSELTTADHVLHQVPQIPQIHRVNLKDFLNQLTGRFVGLDFIKRNGEFRTMIGRFGVQQHNGGTANGEALHRSNMVIWDAQVRDYRTVNLSTVSRVRARGQVYDVIG